MNKIKKGSVIGKGGKSERANGKNREKREMERIRGMRGKERGNGEKSQIQKE